MVDKHLGEPHFQLHLHGNHPSWKSSQKSSQPQSREYLPIFSIYLTDTLYYCFPNINYCPKPEFIIMLFLTTAPT